MLVNHVNVNISVTLLLHITVFGDPNGDLLWMDFIPFNSEPENGNNRQRDEHSSGTKKKRPIDDANQVSRLVVLLNCTDLIFQFRRDLKT